MFKYIIFAASLFSYQESHGQKVATISGVIRGLGTGKTVYLGNRGLGKTAVHIDFLYDSVRSNNDSFHFRPFVFTDVESFSVSVDNERGWQTFLIDTGNIVITSKVDSFGYKQNTQGSVNNDVYNSYFTDFYQPWTDTLNRMFATYNSLQSKGDSIDAQMLRDSALKRYKDAAIQRFMETYTASAYAAFAGLTMRRFPESFPDHELQRYFLMLPTEEQANPHWAKLKYRISGSLAKNTAAGTAFPDFQFLDITGSSKGLYKYESDYKLLDFWASWCAPCLAMAPKIDSALQANSKVGVKLLTLNTDNSFQVFKTALYNYKSNAEKLYAGNYSQSEIIKYLDVNSIPFMILLDKDNKIIRNNINFEQLIEFLRSFKTSSLPGN